MKQFLIILDGAIINVVDAVDAVAAVSTYANPSVFIAVEHRYGGMGLKAEMARSVQLMKDFVESAGI